MVNSDLARMTIADLAAAVRDRAITPTEVVEASLRRIERLQPQVNAYTCLMADQAREQARDIERALARGEPGGTLCGVPVSVKDVVETRDAPTTWGAQALIGYRTDRDATIVSQLRNAGAVLIAMDGKCPDGSNPMSADPCPDVLNTDAVGIALTSVGAATLVGFSIALGIGEARQKKAGAALTIRF